MLAIIRTTSDNADFVELVRQLDADLAVRDGDEHAFYNQFNHLDKIKHVVVAYSEDRPVGCGAIRSKNKEATEVKRMYVIPEERGKGIASQILTALEDWAIDLSFKKCLLETGKKQPEAIALYKNSNYRIIPNFDPYIGKENSVCFEKIITE